MANGHVYYWHVYYLGHIVVSLSVLGLCELAAAAPLSLHVAYTTFIWDLAQCGRSRVPLPGVEGWLLSCHNQNFGFRSDVALIELFICAGHVCNY